MSLKVKKGAARVLREGYSKGVLGVECGGSAW